LEHTGDPFITAGDGGISVDCRFRLAVFRPFIGETLVGRIRASDKSGIFVSVGFFSDIFIPSTYLPENTILYVPAVAS
jgi:DNA-directed RNA polymerase III subunit RPC8